MKKTLLTICTLIMSAKTLVASVPIPFTTGIVYEQPVSHGPAKAPSGPPCVYIEDYTLTFAVNHPDYILNIKDEDDNVVYTTYVWSAVAEVVLPSVLSGDYQIELIMGNWLFTGYINL